MLMLSRKKNEAIQIGDEITVSIVEIRGDKVRLGIEIPKGMPCHTQEAWDAIQRSSESTDNEPAKETS
jgi:carbon storage regulator